MKAFLVLLAYASTPVLANYAIGHIGIPTDGPHVLPVWPGLYAPSGVYVAGLALALRDLAQQVVGRRAAWAILAGAAVSYLVASPALALASGAAFLVSELADFAVYTPLRERGRAALAVLGSGLVGAAIDSALFLWLAFGSLDFLVGQIIGKAWVTAGAALLVWAWRGRGQS